VSFLSSLPRIGRGGKPKLSKSQKAFLAGADRDAAKASEEMKKIFGEIQGERSMLKAALRAEQGDFKSGEWMLDTFHPEDIPLVARIRTLQQSMIEDMENYLSRSE
jgi:hypothetical protein